MEEKEKLYTEAQMQNEKRWAQGMVIAPIIAVSLFNLARQFDYRSRHYDLSIAHDTKQIEKGYVDPSKLEIMLKDNTGDGFNETYLKYDGNTSYVFKLENGIPFVQKYAIKPAEVLPSP